MAGKMITILDGREEKSPFLMDQFREAAFNRGYGVRHIKRIDQCDIIDGKLDDLITDYSIMRGIPAESTIVDNVIIAKWAEENHKTIINMNSLGGVASVSCDKVMEGYAFSINPKIADNCIKTYDAKDLRNVRKALKNGGVKYPFLLKPKSGSLGKGIRLIEREKDLLDGTENLAFMSIQSYIPSECDWRVYVVGGVAVGIIKKGEKESKKNDFEAYATGITIEEEINPDVREGLANLAVEMTKSLNIEYSGCDITMDKNTGKLYALEANNSPAWIPRYVEIMGRSVADYLVEWIDDRRVNQKKSNYEKIKNYVPKRMQYVSRKAQKRYADILDWKEETKNRKGNHLKDRLQNCYLRMIDMEDAGKKVIQEVLSDAKKIIEEVESRELCWAGDFIGSEVHGIDGNLEYDCIPTAYYLAICEKYDKIVSSKLKG